MTKIGTVFSELLKLAPRFQFDQAVERRDGDRYAKSFTAWRQFITLMYAQITGKDSLREIETGLAAQSSRLYHLGLESVRRLIQCSREKLNNARSAASPPPVKTQQRSLPGQDSGNGAVIFIVVEGGC